MKTRRYKERYIPLEYGAVAPRSRSVYLNHREDKFNRTRRDKERRPNDDRNDAVNTLWRKKSFNNKDPSARISRGSISIALIQSMHAAENIPCNDVLIEKSLKNRLQQIQT